MVEKNANDKFILNEIEKLENSLKYGFDS